MSDTNQTVGEDHGGPKAPTLAPSALSFVNSGSNILSTVIHNPSSDTPMDWSVDHCGAASWQLDTCNGTLPPLASQRLHVTITGGVPKNDIVKFRPAGPHGEIATLAITLHT